MRPLSLIATCLVASLARSASAGVDSLFSVIDFEEYSEGTVIALQYKAAYGVEFSLVNGGSPIITQEGNPARAFGSTFGSDLNMSSGSRGLTDPLGADGGVSTDPKAIQIAFDPPVTFLSFYVVDVESSASGTEKVVADAYSGDLLVDSETVVGVAANDGKSSLVTLTGAAITRLVLTPVATSTGNCGWAVDFLTFARPCPTPDCTPRFRLSQESAPDAGDFSTHLLGEIPIWVTPSTSAAAFYGYGVPEGSSWNGAALSPQLERSHLFGAVTNDGPTLFIVHDRYGGDPDIVSGETGVRLEVVNDPNGAKIAVQDDPSGTDAYTGVAGDTVFTAQNIWWKCCTDGLALGDLACGSTVFVEFSNVDNDPTTPVISGLTDWVAYGADGSQIPLALAADRRVRIDLLPPASCPADFTCDGVIGAADLGVLLGAWGQMFGAPDIDGSGLVDAADIAELLGLWGECP